MKRKITLLLLAAGSMFTTNAQVMLQENFTAPFNPTTAGWLVQNLSNPIGTTTWAQGVGSNYPAYNGGINDYFTANFNSCSATPPAGINNWLMTPTVTLMNGGIIQFATKTTFQGAGNPNFAPDRLQLRMSTAGTASTIGIPTTTNSIGSFTDLLLDINPNLNTSTVATVANGIVNGYPNVWTVYSVQITGLAGPVTGRFGFRYWVDDAGFGGANSNNIGLDAVKYALPCGVTVPSYTICSGGSATLQAMGTGANTTYTWAAPASSNNSSIVVSPGATTTYSLDYDEGNGACPTVTAEIAIGTQVSINLSASSTTICAGQTVTLTAVSPAQSFSWTVPNATNPVITVTPNTTTGYTVVAYNGVFPALTCVNFKTVEITVNANPSLSVAITPTLLCDSQGSITITASGATTYNFLNSSTNPQSLATPTAGTWNFQLSGTTNNCTSTGVVVFTVNPVPDVTAVASTPSACVNKTVTITGGGADTYQWAGASTATTAAFTFSSSTAGNQSFTVTGTNAEGCSNTAIVAVNIKTCSTVGIATINGNEETAIFPNPFTTEIKITDLTGNVVIYNAIGQVVVSTKVDSSETINTTELPKGAYLVKAFNSNGELVRTVKLIKN